jgi:hypothetical protein
MSHEPSAIAHQPMTAVPAALPSPGARPDNQGVRRTSGAAPTPARQGMGKASADVPSSEPDFRDLSVAELRRAAEIYMSTAYPDAGPPEAVRRRLAWPDGVALLDLLRGPLFERVTQPGTPGPIFALRLGNHRYPHMKFQVQPWPTEVGYMLSVNTHDQILGLDPASPDAEAFRALQAENQRIKEAIERAWDTDGLPTFQRYLRDYLSNAEANGPSPELRA